MRVQLVMSRPNVGLFTVARVFWGVGGIEYDRVRYGAKFSITLRSRLRFDAWREHDGWLADLALVRLHFKADRA